MGINSLFFVFFSLPHPATVIWSIIFYRVKAVSFRRVFSTTNHQKMTKKSKSKKDDEKFKKNAKKSMQGKVFELKQWQAAWAKHASHRKTASEICPLPLAMGTPLFQLNSSLAVSFSTILQSIIVQDRKKSFHSVFFTLHYTAM